MGRRAEDLASTFWQFLLSVRDEKAIIIFADNCGGQNKNWLLFSSLIRMVNSPAIAADKVCLKFLTTGHTFMSADGDHSAIETALRRKGTVLDMTDFVGCVAKSRLPVKQLMFSDFMEWTDDISTSKLKKLGQQRPMLADVVVCEVRRGSSKLFFKQHSYDNVFNSFDLLKSTASTALPANVKIPRGIMASKKAEIVKKLVPLMPPSRRTYWLSLAVNKTVVDLCKAQDRRSSLKNN
jgi:hypothetical protein